MKLAGADASPSASLDAGMLPRTQSPMTLPVLAAQPWQMSFGERAALEGLLSQLRPALALEIGTAEGGSLKRIAAHSGEVHSFDLVAPAGDVGDLENVVFHTGDSHQQLAQVLADLAATQRSVDFALIDGDHTAEGVRRDIVDVLASPAVTRAVIVLHDTMNAEVRGGIEAAQIPRHPKVALFELDLVPGYLARREPYRLQLWGGLGLIVVDAEGTGAPSRAVRDDRFHELFGIIVPAVEVMRGIEARGMKLDELDRCGVQSTLSHEIANPHGQGEWAQAQLRAVEASLSWRITAPIRRLKRQWSGRSR